MECEFCKKILNTTSSLNYHKKNNKKCLEIQNKGDIESIFIHCEFCDKSFSEKTMKVHLKSCKNKKTIDEKSKDDIIRELNDIIKKQNESITYKDKIIEEQNILINELKIETTSLQNMVCKLETENNIYMKDHELVKNMAMQPKIINNNQKIRVINNFFDNPDKIKKIVNENLTLNHIAEGQKGVAQFAFDKLLKDDDGIINYICTDPSRHIFKYQTKDGNIEKDVKANKLTNLLIDAGIKNKTNAIAPKLWTTEEGSIDNDKFKTYNKSANEIMLTMQIDNSIFRNELATLTSI
jgi:hypothetical protein